MEFARRGFQVTGVDLNPSFIAQAKERTEKEGLSVEFVQKDMREFRRENFYEVGLNLFTSFGFFDDPAEDKKVLENFFVSLRPGGFLLVDVKGKETLAQDFRPRDWHKKDSALLLEEREIHMDRRPGVSSPSRENPKLEDSPVHFRGEGKWLGGFGMSRSPCGVLAARSIFIRKFWGSH